MKKCRSCAEEIQDEAVKCRFCGETQQGTAERKARSQGALFNSLVLALLTFIAVVMGANAYSSHQEKIDVAAKKKRLERESQALTLCKGYLKDIATACEMYASDHEDRYPQSLEELMPAYLHLRVTCCPSSVDAKYKLEVAGKNYWVVCTGDHASQGITSGFPQYESETGNILGGNRY